MITPHPPLHVECLSIWLARADASPVRRGDAKKGVAPGRRRLSPPGMAPTPPERHSPSDDDCQPPSAVWSEGPGRQASALKPSMVTPKGGLRGRWAPFAWPGDLKGTRASGQAPTGDPARSPPLPWAIQKRGRGPWDGSRHCVHHPSAGNPQPSAGPCVTTGSSRERAHDACNPHARIFTPIGVM